ncbi:SphA family protein [Azospirillum sp.]|uniref:SphA family protein n=1 Tax=Azospirillum sp. TaxID=34012 RepID=UPI002D229D31|nr:transporter [Azospirillum sp.]HYD70117.1 transporter [Azospirillum sp.]
MKIFAHGACAVACMAAFAALSTPAVATEGGGGVYGQGSESFLAGALPPPGTYVINYDQYYHAGKFKGDKAGIASFDATVMANATRFLPVFDAPFIGGVWAIHLVLPFVDARAEVNGMSQHKSGLGDIVFSPAILGWHRGNWHYAVGVDIVAPTGRYRKTDIANLGRNHWAIEPVVAVTYLNEAGFEASVKLMYDFNFKNKDTGYGSGNELHADFLVGKHFGNFAAGVAGYAYQQVTGDYGSGAVLGDFKGRVFALGPNLRYQQGGLSVDAKYTREFGAVNKPQGDRIWLKLAITL